LSWLKTNGYEVTERGKITVAVIIVMLLFIIPAIIITAFAWSSPPLREVPNGDQNGNDPIISNTPLPTDGGGLNADDPPGNGNGEQGAYNPPPETPEPSPEPTDDPDETDPDGIDTDEPDPDDPAEPTPTPAPSDPPGQPADGSQNFGPVSMSRSAGTMLFRFSPEHQDALDADTVSMLGDFITSPKNTSDAQISVEIPRLSTADTTALKTAITDAFAEHGVAESKISFSSYNTGSVGNTFDVKLSFVTVRSPK